jgi:endonuclease/exonuclease/phosphatase (EEP) superfamily protein YafD
MLLRITKSAVTVLAVLYSAPVAAWLFFRLLKGEAWPLVGALNSVGVWWFAPLLVLLPVALLVRARQASIMAVLILVAALPLVGPDFTPGLSPGVPADAPRLRVLTYNALISNVAYDAVEAMIREQQPDVIAVQELSHEMAAEITARVGSDYPYQLLHPWSDPRGMGIWSRYPIASSTTLTLYDWENWAQYAQLDVGGRAVHFWNLHLWPIGTLDRTIFARNLIRQHEQAEQLGATVAGLEGPVLVAGDLNASPTNRTYALLNQELDDAWREAAFGPGFTFPAPGTALPGVPPFLRIDYLWTKGPLTALEVRVLDSGAGSDHLPLVGEFALGE